MSRLSDYLDGNPSVTKLLAAAFAVGVIATGNAAMRADVEEARIPATYGAAVEAGQEIRLTLSEAAMDFAEMGQLFESGLSGTSLRAEMLDRAHAAQERLLDVLDRVETLESGVNERIRAQRPAVIAWMASGLLVDVESALESYDYAAAREAVAELQGWIPEIDAAQSFAR